MWPLSSLFDPANSGLVGGIGTAVGVLSFFLALVGFGITLWQLRQVRSVTAAQREAIAGLRIRLSQFDAIQECAKAEAALAELRKHLFAEKATISLETLDVLATSFVSLLEGSHAINDDVRARLRTAIGDITKLSEAPQSRASEHSSPAKQAATIRDYHGLIVKIRAQVQEEHGQ